MNELIRKLKKRLEAFSHEPLKIDPAIFNDPLALTISWEPAKKGGNNFPTFKQIESDPNIIVFRPTYLSLFFYSFFFLSGCFIIGVAIKHLLFDYEVINLFYLIPFFIGLVFTFIGLRFIIKESAPLVFDKYAGYFYKGWTRPDFVSSLHSSKSTVTLDSIYALQLLAELCTAKNSRYYSYEINLVLRDGTRINVIDHSNLTQIRKDAQMLSAFLGVPLWDGITIEQ